jgi:hypothetical protein
LQHVDRYIEDVEGDWLKRWSNQDSKNLPTVIEGVAMSVSSTQIIRAKHTPENSTTISHQVFANLRGAPEALCVMLFLLSRADKANPQPIEIEQNNLAEEVGIKKGEARKALNRLTEINYLVRHSNSRFTLPASVIAENTLYLTAEEIEALDNEMANRQ